MGRNKNIRKHIAGLQRTMREHELKIEEELRKDYPNRGLIKKWSVEIQNDKDRIVLLKQRMARRKNAKN